MGDTVLVIPRESHEPMRQAIAPNLSSFNSPADVKGFIVIAIGDGRYAYEMRTDLHPADARSWLLGIALGVPEANGD